MRIYRIITPLLILLIAGAVWSWNRIDDPASSILFITVDTLNRHHMSIYGYPLPTTPHLERLARQGIRFNRVYATASWTPPAMATLFYGGLPYDHGVTDWNTPPSPRVVRRSWVRALRGLGYKAYFFSNHPGLKSPAPLICRLFDRCEILGVDDLGLVQRVASTVRNRKDPGPVLVWVHFIGPHEPFLPRLEIEQLWVANTALPSPPAPICPPPMMFGAGCIPSYLYPIPVPYEYTVERLRARYDAEIYETDRAINGLIRRLVRKRKGWVVSVTADHGEIIYHPGELDHPPLFFSHGTYLYDELIHIPWILYGADIPEKGLRVSSLISQTDIPATVFYLATGRRPEGWPGRVLKAAEGWRSGRRWITAWEARARWTVLVDAQGNVWWYRDGMVYRRSPGPRPWEAVEPPGWMVGLLHRMGMYLEGLSRVSRVEVSKETRSVLRSLGYVQP